MTSRNNCRGLSGLVLIGLLIVSVAAHAERPRIGLVLGGGGARGAAHIGVLKELERQRIPIDAIAGTSMGAIIGGLYAAGKTPAQLEEIVREIDWAAALSDTPPREHLSFRRKLDDERYPITGEIGIRRDALVLPMGLIEGQQLSLVLREYTIDVSYVDDFDDLPIPFRAVATDIETGEAHVMGSGDLAQAIRASMSVPAIFAPTRVDGKLLVDGGVARNLPVDVMREMGVDIIIAVDVEFPMYPGEELVSAVKVSEQVVTIMMRRETARQIALLDDDDILIRPELGTFDSADFAATPDTILPGEEATIAVSGQLSKHALAPDDFERHLAARGAPAPLEATLDFVRVDGDGTVATSVLESNLGVSAGDTIDTGRLASSAADLYGLNQHELVSYRIVEEDGETGVVFDARGKSYGPNILKFALSLENDFEGASAFNVGTRLTRVGINARGAEWQTDLQLGTDPQLLSEFYQPFSAGSAYFLAPRINLWQENLNVFSSEDAIGRYRISESEVGIDLGRQIGNIGEFRLGAYGGAGNARLKVGDPQLPNLSYDTGGLIARLRFDTRDTAQFPRRGVRADAIWNASLPDLGADDRFDTVATVLDGTWSWGKNSWTIGAFYATTLDSQGAVQDYFTLGGLFRLSGLERGEISGPHAAMARLIYYRRVSESTGDVLDFPVYLGASLEAGNTWQSRSDIDFQSALVNGSLFTGFDTPIGSLYLGVGFAEGGRSNYYLSFGTPPRW